MRNQCSIPDCGKTAVAHRWCNKHYLRWRIHGDPLITLAPTITGPRSKPPIERFLALFCIDTTFPFCWTWTGSLQRKGYGLFQHAEGTKAHRFSYMFFVDPCLSDDATIDHICRNRACVNPEHLEAVPNVVNILRGLGPTAINARKTHCKRGHPFNTSNTRTWKGGRYCRACEKERARQRRRAQ